MEIPIVNVEGCICYEPIRTRYTTQILSDFETLSDFIYIVLLESNKDDIKKYCDALKVNLSKYRTNPSIEQHHGFFLIKETLNLSWLQAIGFHLAAWGIDIDDVRIDKQEVNMDFPEKIVDFHNGWKHEMWGEEGDRLIKKIKGLTESVIFLPGEWEKTTRDEKIERLNNIEAVYENLSN